MSLIKCTMCNKDISPNAVSCPHCGEPRSVETVNKHDENATYNILKKNVIAKYESDLIKIIMKEKGLDALEGIKVVRNKHTALHTFNSFEDAKAFVSKIEPYGDFEIEKVTGKGIDTQIEIVFKTASKDITCKNCGSTDTTKISGVDKVASGMFFGIFAANKIKNSWECRSCGYRW